MFRQKYHQSGNTSKIRTNSSNYLDYYGEKESRQTLNKADYLIRTGSTIYTNSTRGLFHVSDQIKIQNVPPPQFSVRFSGDFKCVNLKQTVR